MSMQKINKVLNRLIETLEFEGPKPRSLVSFNAQIMHMIKKALPQFKWKKSNWTAEGVEGVFWYKQPDGRIGRYYMFIKKIGLE